MRPLIGLLLETYPTVSETFIVNEILELERQGLDLHIFSLRHPSEGDSHPDAVKIKAPITYVPSLLPEFDRAAEKELVSTQLALFEQDSDVYLETLKHHLKRDQHQRLNEFLQAGYLAQLLKDLGIIHLHAHFADIPVATAEIVKAFSGISYSISVHTKDIYIKDTASLNRRMAKANFICTCSEYNRCYLDRISTSHTPIHVAYHGIDVGCFNPPPKRQQSDIPLILSGGYLCEDNGFHYLLETFHLLQQEGTSFQGIIFGNGPSEDSIRQQINGLGLNEHVTLVNHLSQEQLIDYYQKATLFVLPYLVSDSGNRDGIPHVLLEAMAMEIPVVSTSILGISELMHSYYNGVLVPEKDSLSLAKALEALMEQPELSSTLGKAGRLTVLDKFSLASNVGALKDSLIKAIQPPIRLKNQENTLADLLKLAAS